MSREEDVRRKDDSIMRKIAVGVTVAIVMQAGFSIYYAGSLSNQVANNTKALALVAEKQHNQEKISVAISRVETQIAGLSTTIERMMLKVETIDREQQRRTNIVERADSFMSKKGE